MGMYDPTEPLSWLIEQLEKGQEFAISVGQTITNAMIVSKGITLLAQTVTFNEDNREWQQQSAKINAWIGFNLFSSRAHR